MGSDVRRGSHVHLGSSPGTRQARRFGTRFPILNTRALILILFLQQYGSSAQASLSAEALNRFSQLKPVNHSTESLLDEHPRTGDLRRKVTFFQPDKVDLPDLESDDYYKRYFGSELQESARGSSKFATEAARRKRQEKKQLASALYDDSQY